jgi:DNA polymerase III epsilon subunit-like protein
MGSLDYVALDFETANSARNSACSIGLAKVENGKVVNTFSSFIKPPENYFAPINISIHGITPAHVAKAPAFDQVWPELIDFIGDNLLISHGARFDGSVLLACLDTFGLPVPNNLIACSLQAARNVWPELPSHKLPYLMKQIGIDYLAHNALQDAVAISPIIKSMANSIAWNNDIYSLLDSASSFPFPLRKCPIGNMHVHIDKSDIDRSVNSLIGIIKGIMIDGVVNETEVSALKNWYLDHREFELRYPYRDIVDAFNHAFEDNVIEICELEDILWLCEKIAEEGFYTDGTESVQILYGILYGIIADDQVNDTEIYKLKDWLDCNWIHSNIYPFDEIRHVVNEILQDGQIDENEREMFKGILQDFSKQGGVVRSDTESVRAGCTETLGMEPWSKEPLIISKHQLVLTGESTRMKRAEIQKLIEEKGGMVQARVGKCTDYLVVGEAGNPAWAYTTYGKKIEDAISLQKQGSPVRIVKETALWAAMEVS